MTISPTLVRYGDGFAIEVEPGTLIVRDDGEPLDLAEAEEALERLELKLTAAGQRPRASRNAD